MNIYEILNEEYDKLCAENPKKDVTVWNAFTSAVKRINGENVRLYILTLKADIGIIEQIARGYCAYNIAMRFGISSKSIRDVADTWGLYLFDKTLDFDCLEVYSEGITAESLAYYINMILPDKINLETANYIINNVEKYNTYIEILEEEYKSE